MRKLLIGAFAIISVLGIVAQTHNLWEEYHGAEFYTGDLEIYMLGMLAVIGTWIMTQMPKP